MRAQQPKTLLGVWSLAMHLCRIGKMLSLNLKVLLTPSLKDIQNLTSSRIISQGVELSSLRGFVFVVRSVVAREVDSVLHYVVDMVSSVQNIAGEWEGGATCFVVIGLYG